MKWKYYILIVLAILLIIWGVFFIFGIGARCYDGNSYAFYISKSEFSKSIEKKLNITNDKFYYIKEKDLSVIDNLDKIAYQTNTCGRISHSIKIGDKLKKVSGRRYENFIASKLPEVVKFNSKSWDGPAYSVFDYTNNKEYIIDIKDKNGNPIEG